ncbi:predicted protein [Phaeodactylum tricornutum CCAP 1055/1]|uniref:Hypoxanthine phosphoribosyltransferase n=2 Tax=Phaeodactylum tricornutum TaxID=2850 RepID=B7FYM2_PHATC|nr:predicted protein [Phaeodactylum tricornutum CCAP 1055/1]EEC48187.1 predicted protein [Phaeodactylum tricornutum CCAP 1055/1]|eukprot:XP_002179996.1 predicted protein [Phaeodactylum tricornutum CCAP 1055/1]
MRTEESENDRLAPVFVHDEPKYFEKEAHLYPPEYEGHFESLVMTAETIRSRVRDLAAIIKEDYAGMRPVLLCTLKGACPFYTHLTDALQDLCQGYDMEFVRASSYEGTSSSGNVIVSGVKPESLQHRHVLIIEDILDTGTTLAHLVPHLEDVGKPASLEVCTLLDKRLEEPKKYVAKYVGFSIPNHFIIGYGLDYNELYRDLKDIFIISKEGISFDRSNLHS